MLLEGFSVESCVASPNKNPRKWDWKVLGFILLYFPWFVPKYAAVVLPKLYKEIKEAY